MYFNLFMLFVICLIVCPMQYIA